jgi:hypothetical protein
MPQHVLYSDLADSLLAVFAHYHWAGVMLCKSLAV